MTSVYIDEGKYSKRLPPDSFVGVQAVDTDAPDTIEHLIHQLYSQTQDHKDATINLRYNLLGSFPSVAENAEKNASPEGLVNQMKAVLRLAIRNMNEAREHITYISKDVR